MFLRPRMTRYGGHAGPYVWGGVTGVTDRDNPWLTAVQQNTATRLVVQAKSYDAEQRFLVNENPSSVREALGVGLGSAGGAGPIFAPDKDGGAVWFGQSLAAAHVSCTVPALTSASTFTVEGTYRGRLSPSGDTYLALLSGGAYVQLESSGEITFFDGSAADTSASTVATLLSLSASWDEFEWRAAPAGTSVDVDVRVPGGSWVSAISGATITAVSPGGQTLYYGSSSTTKGMRAVGRRLTIRDGGVGAVKVAEFTPGLFVGGNRADGDTAVDAYGVTWTVERPAATTDMPRVMVGGSEQYISLPGVAGEYLSTPDTAANSITGDIDIRINLENTDWSTPLGTTYVFMKKGDAPDRAFFFGHANYNLIFDYTTDGSTSVSKYGNALPADTKWVRATQKVDNGSGGNDIKFWTSEDGVTWSQYGATVTTPGTITRWDSSSNIEVGENVAGDLLSAELYDGIDGTLVERIDAAEANPNSTTWTSSTSGATVTVNKSASAQYHATVVPAGVTIVQGDGVNDFAQVCGDDTITDFDPGTGLSLVLDASFSSGAGSGGVLASSANATTDDGLIVSRNSTNPRVQGRLDDGTTIATVGDNANNVTYDTRFQATFAFGSSDHEAFVDGVSVEAATDAVTAETAAGPLRFFAEIDGSNPAAYDLYGAAVLGERTSDTEAAAYATEGLTR